MNLNVTQENLYLFLPSKVSWMAEMLSEDKNISMLMQSKRYTNLIPIADWKQKKQNFGIWDQWHSMRK